MCSNKLLDRLHQLMNVRQIAMLWVLGGVRCAKTINHRVTNPTKRIIVLKLRVKFCSKALFGSIVPLATAC